MCTVVKYNSGDFYFGRTLDHNCSYGEEVVIVPRRYEFALRDCGETLRAHYAIMGMAHVADDVPLFYDAVNEKGLAAAGLNFVGNAVYHKPCANKTNIAQFEVIPYLLARCATVNEAKRLLADMNITDTSFGAGYEPALLHWMIADAKQAIVVESVADGLHVYDDPAGVMTNNPPFPTQLHNLNNYMHVSPLPPKNNFSDKLQFDAYSLGMGGLGLPGDLSSGSRFVRAAFVALNSPPCDCEKKSVAQFFHILDSVAQPLGSCVMPSGEYESTICSSCCNATRGIYYYNSYNNRRIIGVDMHAVGLDGRNVFRYPLILDDEVYFQNKP